MRSRWQRFARRLADGEVVLGTALAQRLGVGIGADVLLQTGLGPRALRVAGTANEYTIDGMALYMEWHVARRLFQVEGVHVFSVTARTGMAATLAENLKTFCGERTLILQSQQELRGYIDQAVGRIAGMVWALMALVFVVAALAVINTLTMNVLEQTRELGLLRAIGLKRGQLGKLILAQALAIGLLSIAPGTIIGLVFAYVFNVVSHSLLAHAVAFRIDTALVAGCVAATMVTTVLAAIVPARRAARLEIIQALQYE
jgi:putative ABC transport system permease protein